MRGRTRLSLVAVTAALGSLVAIAAVAWACVPTARLSVTPTSGAAGTNVMLRGSGFPETTATLSWQDGDGSNSQPLPPGTIAVGDSPFEVPLKIPDSATGGPHLIEVRVGQGTNNFQAAAFTVTTPQSNNGGGGGGGGYQVPNPFTGGSITVPSGRCQGRANTRVGTNGNDVIVGTRSADVISAGRGNDVVRGLGGGDRVCAGSGNDNVSGGSGADRVTGSSGRDRLSGGSGGDRLAGNSGRDRLSGNAGRDRLSGGTGRDRLAGGPGRDRMNGGPGTDSCVTGRGDWATLSCE